MVETAQEETLRFGAFELTPDALTISSTGETVKLQAQPLRLLRLLTTRPGRVGSQLQRPLSHTLLTLSCIRIGVN